MRALSGLAVIALLFCWPAQAQDGGAHEDGYDRAFGLLGMTDEQRVKFDDAEEAYASDDYVHAYALLSPLASQGVSAAIWLLGVMDFDGKGTKKDAAKAKTRFLEAANSGSDFYQVSLADLYRDGTPPFAKDCAQAADLYRKAATQGNEIAKGRLKQMATCQAK